MFWLDKLRVQSLAVFMIDVFTTAAGSVSIFAIPRFGVVTIRWG